MFKWLGFGLVLSSLMLSVQAAEIYSWRDADGVMHFGEKPPENAKELKQRTIPDTPPADNDERDHVDDSQRLLRAFDEERAERNQQKAQQKVEQQKRAQQCSAAKKELERFETSTRRLVTDAKGQQRELNPTEDREYGRQLREAAAALCDGR